MPVLRRGGKNSREQARRGATGGRQAAGRTAVVSGCRCPVRLFFRIEQRTHGHGQAAEHRQGHILYLVQLGRCQPVQALRQYEVERVRGDHYASADKQKGGDAALQERTLLLSPFNLQDFHYLALNADNFAACIVGHSLSHAHSQRVTRSDILFPILVF